MTAKNFLTRTQLPALIERAQKYADENAANWEAHDGLKQTAVYEYIPEIVNRWSRAVDKYELIECGLSKDEFEAALLNGAKTWRQYSAAGYLYKAYTDLRAECRQFYIVRSSRNARRVGGYIERYSVFEHVANTDKSVPLSTQMIRVAEFKLYTSAYRGEEHEAAAALVKAGKLPAEVLTPSGYFDKDNYGEYSGLCAYCTFETLSL